MPLPALRLQAEGQAVPAQLSASQLKSSSKGRGDLRNPYYDSGGASPWFLVVCLFFPLCAGSVHMTSTVNTLLLLFRALVELVSQLDDAGRIAPEREPFFFCAVVSKVPSRVPKQWVKILPLEFAAPLAPHLVLALLSMRRSPTGLHPLVSGVTESPILETTFCDRLFKKK
eukprot:RCo014621